jgi:hypothetical protein
MEAKSGLAIEVGRVVYTNLYNRGRGVIYEVIGEPAPSTVQSIGGFVQMGGRCEVNIAFEDDRRAMRLPECILLGVQWRLRDEVLAADEVARILASSLAYEAAAKAKEDEKRAAFAKAQEAARAEGLKLGLIPEAQFRAAGKRGSAAAYNLRLELKAKGIKARVKQDGYSSIDIYIADEKDLPEAKAIGCKYEAGRFDGMTDCYDYDPSAWGSVFGDVRYVFERVEGK